VVFHFFILKNVIFFNKNSIKRNIFYIFILLWGLGIGDWGLGPIPNPQSPIPNPQSPNIIYIKKIEKNNVLYIYIYQFIKNY